MSLDEFEKIDQKEKEEFSRICNMLLSITYILRDGIDGRISKDYRFIESHFELFYDYLELIGWKINKDSRFGIIYVRNVDEYNKLILNKLTTVMLITMRVIYEELRTQANNSNDVCLTVGDLFGKIINELSIYPKVPSQKEKKESFRILESHNIIKRLDDSLNDPENRFVILPSILIAVSNEKCKMICETLKAESEEVENEITDTAAAD